MGLDMYLKAKRAHWVSRFSGEDIHPVSEFSEALKKVPVPKAFGCSFPEVVECEAVYWRKANAIHNWFVENVQDGEDDCQSYYVGPHKLKDLRDTIRVVLENPNKAEELLPTQSGCFFGDTSYDEEYFRQLLWTENQLTAILEMPEKEREVWDFYYQSSW